MTTPHHHIRPCDAPQVHRRAARVLPPLPRPRGGRVTSEASDGGGASPPSSCPNPAPNPNPNRPRLSPLPAFSLIELVIVLSIASILAAIAIPRYGSLIINYRIDSAANRVISDLAVAQAQARASSTTQPVVFTPATNSYQLTGLTHPDATTRQYIIKLTDDPYQTTLFSAAFGPGFGITTITFDMYGRPDNGGTITLRCGTRTKIITVDANTGKCSTS